MSIGKHFLALEDISFVGPRVNVSETVGPILIRIGIPVSLARRRNVMPRDDGSAACPRGTHLLFWTSPQSTLSKISIQTFSLPSPNRHRFATM